MQGQERKTWVQAILIGDIALVGVPAEFFTVLGQEIKRRSPFRYTYVFELGQRLRRLHPRRRGHDRGGYQVWTGPAQLRWRQGPARRSSTRPSSCSNACTENSAVAATRSDLAERRCEPVIRPHGSHVAVGRRVAPRSATGTPSGPVALSSDASLSRIRPFGHLLPGRSVSFSPRNRTDIDAQCVLRAAGGLVGLARPARPCAGPAPAEERAAAPRTPAEELATLRLADPAPEDRAGRRRAGRHQPGGDRLGRERAGSTSPR